MTPQHDTSPAWSWWHASWYADLGTRERFAEVTMRRISMQQLTLQGLNDPFTLLKIIQTFREIPVNEALEIFCREPGLLEELCKVLPQGSFQLEASPERGDGSRAGIVLRKTASTNDRPPAGGCRCS